MSAAPALHIGTLRSRFVSQQALDPAQVRQWHDALTECDADELVGQLVRDDEWLLIRRLPLHARWGVHSAASEASHVWWQALQSAVQDAAAYPDARNVLRYRTRRQGLADLLYRSALGEVERQWAWQRMGLIPQAAVSASEVLERGWLALLAAPDEIWPVLHHLLHAEADTGAFTALVRRWPRAAWLQCVRAAPQVRVGLAEADMGPDRPDDDNNNSDVATMLAAERRWREPGSMAALLWQWIGSQPHLARPLQDVWGLWLTALIWPRGGAPGETAARQHALAAALAAVLDRREGPWRSSRDVAAVGATADRALRRTDPAAVHPVPLRPATAASSPLASDAARAPGEVIEGPLAPALPEPAVSLRTDWAGVFFFLRHLMSPEVAPVSMQALLQAMTVAMDDPVVSVLLCGQPLQVIDPVVQAQADHLVTEWACWLDQVMPDAPSPRLPWVCRRPGRLLVEPGWIVLHLDLKQVDTRLRRVGLDLDPGWVPQLGAVVRICYE